MVLFQDVPKQGGTNPRDCTDLCEGHFNSAATNFDYNNYNYYTTEAEKMKVLKSLRTSIVFGRGNREQFRTFEIKVISCLEKK